MEQSCDSSQFVPGSLLSLRRTSTGSLSSLKKQANQQTQVSCTSRQVSSQFRHNPIAGGSWDDNSVGHGTVAARMRRERNRAIQQTKSPSLFSSHSFNTHSHITSTLNLINTTSLSPWQQHDLSPWDDDYNMINDLNRNTAASKRSAGSLFNIPSSGTQPSWDARSIPDYVKSRPPKRTSYRHSYTSAYHHSSPTSGCASMAGSDIDSSDLAFFSMTDDSSLFDADSLFSDSYGVLEADSGFSTNIYNLLEEGTISCRTPFLNTDWTDSVSELDFDCSEQQSEDITNCDAHSDIGPSCSAPTERNRLKKRQIRVQDNQLPFDQSEHVGAKIADVGSRISDAGGRIPDAGNRIPDVGGRIPDAGSMIPDTGDRISDLAGLVPDIPLLSLNKTISTEMSEAPFVESDPLTPVQCSPSSLQLETAIDVESFLQTNFPTPTCEVKVHPGLEPGFNMATRHVGELIVGGAFSSPMCKLTLSEGTVVDSMRIPRGATPVQAGVSGATLSQGVMPVYQEKVPGATPVSHGRVPEATSVYQGGVTPTNPVSHGGIPEATPLSQRRVPGTTPVPNERIAFLSDGVSGALPELNDRVPPVQSVYQGWMPLPPLQRRTPDLIPHLESELPVEQTLASNVADWNNLPLSMRLGLVEQLSDKISKTMSLQEQLDIIHILGADDHIPFHMSIDDIDGHKLSRVLGYLDNHKCASTPGHSTTPPSDGGLRRSNSDGNIAKSASDAQKEHRRRQRQARRFAKWLKQRQRKENRQQLKEQRSGLFVNEEKVKLEIASEEVEVDV